MFGRGRWQTIIRFTSFIVHADAIYAISLSWVPASSLFSCLIEGCCDTAIQGRDCRGQHSSDQALHIKQYKSSISTTTCHVFKHRNVADGADDAWESFHGQLLCNWEDAGEFAAKSALVKEGSVTLLFCMAVRQWFETQFAVGFPWHGRLIKVQLRKQLMTWGNAELHKFILWECLTSRHLWCKNNDHQRGYVMCHVRQYIPIQNSINKDVGPLNWQNPIRWIFGRTSNHLLDSGWLHCSSCPEVTLATSMASNFGRQQGLWSIFRGNGWLIIEKNTWNIYLYWSRS